MRLITPLRYRSTRTRRGELTADLVVDLCRGFKGVWTFLDSNGAAVAVLRDDILTLFSGFACDLCSPAFRAGRWWLGTPTTKREALGAFLHDFTRGCLGANNCPWSREDTDDLFRDALGLERSRVRVIYHFLVSSPVGTVFMRLTHRTLYLIEYIEPII